MLEEMGAVSKTIVNLGLKESLPTINFQRMRDSGCIKQRGESIRWLGTRKKASM